MTNLNRLKIYEAFFHKINMALLVHNNEKVQEALSIIDAWSYAHRVGNGEYTAYEQKKIVDRIVEKMDKF